ncbi:MAG: ACP S-malonyltransferase [Acidimicrobiia bacterium]
MTTPRFAVIFPGQGTQAPGMASAWTDHPAWKLVEQAEAALNEPLGTLITTAPESALTRTREAQLAVLLTSLVAWEAARPMLAGAPVCFAGHSLGQVSALIAAGALSIEDGVRFAAMRAEATQKAADTHPGRMAALIGATPEEAEAVCAAVEGTWIANDNAPGQIVIAGTPEGIEAALAEAKNQGIKRAIPLNVGGAFHTPLMTDATTALTAVLADLPIAAPTAPVVANDDATPVTDPEAWRIRLARHVSVPVRWRTSMATIAELTPDACLEVGHGTMLAGLAKRTTPDLVVRSLATPNDLLTLNDPISG